MFCLSMIVRNEELTITRALLSVLPFISCYKIHDTGSSDDTISVIQKILKDIDGEICEDKWQNYESNRNLALQDCIGDWIISLDADEVVAGNLVVDNNIDCYDVLNTSKDNICWRPRVFKNNGNFKYFGRTHECLRGREKYYKARLQNFQYFDYRDSYLRRTGLKFEHDIEQMTAQYKETPDDPNTCFYMGQVYCAAKKWREAIPFYEKRILMEIHPEQTHYAQIFLDHCKKMMARD